MPERSEQPKQEKFLYDFTVNGVQLRVQKSGKEEEYAFTLPDIVPGSEEADDMGIQSNQISLIGLSGHNLQILEFAEELAKEGWDAFNIYHKVESEIRELRKRYVVARELYQLKQFFGYDIYTPPLPPEITQAKIERWMELGFELRYLPPIDMTEDKEFPGWKHKPGRRYTTGNIGSIEFYDDLKKIRDLPENRSNPNLLDLTPTQLPGTWVLTDIRDKPNYKDGKQKYENDEAIHRALLELYIKGVINEEAPECWRNNIHPDVFKNKEFWDAIRTVLDLDDIPGAIIRLPRVIEANVLGQGLGFHDTTTWEWCEEYYKSGQRLTWGDADFGGASAVSQEVDSGDADGFRPFVVFPAKGRYDVT